MTNFSLKFAEKIDSESPKMAKFCRNVKGLPKGFFVVVFFYFLQSRFSPNILSYD